MRGVQMFQEMFPAEHSPRESGRVQGDPLYRRVFNKSCLHIWTMQKTA